MLIPFAALLECDIPLQTVSEHLDAKPVHLLQVVALVFILAGRDGQNQHLDLRNNNRCGEKHLVQRVAMCRSAPWGFY